MTVQSLHDAAHAVDARRARSRQKRLGASDVGGCRRKAGYTLAGVRPTNQPSKMRAIMGSWLHAGALDALSREHGALTEVELEDEVLRGHADAVYIELPGADLAHSHDPVTVDVEDLKTRSINVWSLFNEHGPYESEWWQVALYADLIRRGKVKKRGGILHDIPASALRIRTLRIRGLCRDNGDERVFERPYTQELADAAWAWLDEVLDAPDPLALPKDHAGPSTSPICQGCPFMDRCWPPREDGRAPEAVVEDALVAGALAEYHEQQQIEAAAKKRKAQARAMLDAAVPGRYGDLVLGWSGGKGDVAARPDLAAIEKDYADRGEPMPVYYPKPSRSISVKAAPTVRPGNEE